jgi:ABC-2 type transport system ATP-binding protein
MRVLQPLADPSRPLVIRGLEKRYKGGTLAVAGLDLEIGPGQVFGLLGLNGAGKTTTLRTILGLVRPTAGEIRIFGEPVRPGAPVLGTVGALVDTPAFLPHRSGLANLELLWLAGGGKLQDARIDAALAAAGIESVARDKVRTYSFGMRQRLGLAQALMGGPRFLVLDEPTTGLDPQQVREVRQLLGRIAASGVTVLFSSHLLAEVEQVCTHVAVISHGRLLASGTLAELTQAAQVIYLEVDDVSRAYQVLVQLPGLTSVKVEGKGLSVRIGAAERANIAERLVAAGVRIQTIASRHQLEEAFMGILAGEQQDQRGQP